MNSALRNVQTKLLYWIFFAQAFVGGGIFARIPDIQTQAGLNDAQLGIALTAASVGGLVSLLVSGQLVQRFGTRPTMILCLPLLTLTHIWTAMASGLWILIVALLLAGAAFSISNVAMNVEADRREAMTGHRVMNRCHGWWSLGMLAASLVGVGARALPVSPLFHFTMILALVVPVSVLFWAMLEHAPTRAGSTKRGGFAMPDRLTMLLLLFGLSATVAQIAVQNWSVLFMQDRFGGPAWIDTLTLPAFLAMMALGRLYADTWITRWGAERLSKGLALLSFLGGILVIASPSLWGVILGFALTGIGTAAIFPMMITAAANTQHRPPEDSVSAVIFSIGLVVLVVPAAMGWIAEIANLRWAFATTLPLFVMTFGLARIIARPGTVLNS